MATITRKEANQRWGTRHYRIARCGKCRTLYLRPMPDKPLIGEACACGSALGLTTWGKSQATLLESKSQ